jgi:hypothetical protein
VRVRVQRVMFAPQDQCRRGDPLELVGVVKRERLSHALCQTRAGAFRLSHTIPAKNCSGTGMWSALGWNSVSPRPMPWASRASS